MLQAFSCHTTPRSKGLMLPHGFQVVRAAIPQLIFDSVRRVAGAHSPWLFLWTSQRLSVSKESCQNRQATAVYFTILTGPNISDGHTKVALYQCIWELLLVKYKFVIVYFKFRHCSDLIFWIFAAIPLLHKALSDLEARYFIISFVMASNCHTTLHLKFYSDRHCEIGSCYC